jgi:hypothetical protein
MKNMQIIIILLALVLHATISADLNAVYCIQEVNNKAVDCCRNIDLNGDGLDDLLVSCGMPNGRAYAELINLKEKGFCIRRNLNAGSSIIVGVPLCPSNVNNNKIS